MSYLKLLLIQINLPIFTDSKEHELWSIHPGWAKSSWSSATHVSHDFSPFLKGFLNRSCPSLVLGVLEPSAAEVGEVRTLWGLYAQVYLRGLCFKRFCSRSLPAVVWWVATLGKTYKLGRTSQLHKYYSIYKYMIFFGPAGSWIILVSSETWDQWSRW